MPHQFASNPSSDVISDQVLQRFGDALRIHHAFSRQALSKDRFEFALEQTLNRSGISAELSTSRTNRGHDITINGERVGLKSEAAKAIKADMIHISKWMELGKGPWDLSLLLNLFLDHLNGYERVFTLRFLQTGSPAKVCYELVEIPKCLLLKAAAARLEIKHDSRQNPKPGYGYVEDQGSLLYALYFDGGTERKLQIKSLRKDLCVVHAAWNFETLTL